MSYRITEAERKHVATIEDLKLNLSVVEEAGTTPAVNLEITDDDKLNLSATFPQYAIEIDRTDDEHSRFRIVNAQTRNTVMTCDGLTSLNGNPMGLGWRYGLEFILDDDNYVKGISLVNKNNGNKADKVVTKIADMEIKSIIIPESDQVKLTVNSKALFTKAVSINVNSTDNALTVRNETGKHAVIGNVQFTDDYDIKSEGISRLATIETDDIELVGNDTEVSITPDSTSFKNTNINLDNVEIEGNNDSKLLHFEKISSRNVIADSSTIDTVTANTINSTTENVNVLNASSADIIDLESQVGSVDILSSNSITANENITTENLISHGRTRLEGDTYARAIDVNERLVAGEIKSLSKVDTTDLNATNVNTENAVINNADIAVSEVVTEKAASIETRNIKITRQMDALKVTSRTDVDAARDIIAGNGVISDLIKSKDNKVLLEKANDNDIILGNINNLTVIKTSSDPTKSVFEEEFGHVKAVVDGKTVYLANLEDVKSDRFDGYVNRSTNQDISGVKTFNDVLVAPAGIGIKDDEGHFRGIISHVEDYSDIAFKQNPDWVAALQEANEYDDLLANYNHLRLDYNTLQGLKTTLEEAQATLEAAEANHAAQLEDDTNLRTEKDDLVQQIAEWNTSLAEASANLTTQENRLSELQASVNALTTPYLRAQSDLDNELADPDIMSIALRETLYFGRDFDDSFLRDNADYEYLRDEINCTNLPYAEALTAFDKMISILNILSESTQDNVVSYCEITKAHIIRTLRPTIENNHLALVNIRDNALNELNNAREAVTAFENGELAEAQRTKAFNINKINLLNAQLNQIESDITINSYEIEHAESDVQAALDDKTEKELDYTRAKDVFASNYRLYSERLSFDYTDEMIENGEFDPPEMSENVRRFKNDEIPQTDYQPSDTIYLGNSKDTLKVMSKGLHSGENIDQHIQATIDGHDHILANADDIVAKNVMSAFDTTYIDEATGREMVDPGKFVGAINTIASEDDATIVIGKAKVITGYDGQVLPEDQVRPTRIDEEIHLRSEDGSLTIKSTDDGTIDFAVNGLDNLDERLKTTITDMNFNNASLVVTKEDGTEDILSFTSSEGDLSIEAADNKTLDINMNNFYNTENVLKDDILSLYDQVQPRDMRKVPNAFDVKVLMDAVDARVDVLAKNLEERLPVAPNDNDPGRYYLVANVRKNNNGETTATYTWDGTGSLPEVHVPTDISELLSYSDYDADGNLFVPYEAPEYAEYSLKMRVIKQIDDVGNVRYMPRVMWVRMDKDSADYDAMHFLRNHPAVINAVNNGMSVDDAVRALVTKIDRDADLTTRYIIYDFNNRDWSANGTLLSRCFRQEGHGKIGANLADIVDFNENNVKILLDTSTPDAVFAAQAPNPDPNKKLYDVANINGLPLVEITSEEEAKNILITDGSLIGLVSKDPVPYIGD